MARKLRSQEAPLHVSFTVLLVIIAMMFIHNVFQMTRIESITRSMTATPDLDTAKQKAAQSWFNRPLYYGTIPSRPAGTRKDLVKPGDFIYYKDKSHWDSAPIVVESHRLIFFSVPKSGCTVWKQLFRRMMGYSDWSTQDGDTLVPHNPAHNGLKYLYDYPIEKASEMMTSPEWTRAMMVRDPKERFLSSFLDKAVSNDHSHIIGKCCPDSSCVDDAQTIEGFLELAKVCFDDHWRAQNDRVDFKYWPYIDFIAHVESAAEDTKTLLQRIGAWEEFGKSGWGKDRDLAIFESKDTASAGEHATYAQWQVWTWYTPAAEVKVERHFHADYENPLFNFTRGRCLTCPEAKA